MLLAGIYPALTTPFYPDGRLYLRKLEHNVNRWSRTSASGLVVLGSTGEAVMLGDDETRDVLRAAADSAAPEKVLLAGIGRESLHETLRLAEYAAGHRYDAVLVRTPHYYPQYGLADQTRSGALGILTYYRTLADRSPLPVVLYSIPKFTHYEIPVDIVAELAQHPNIIGIKDSSGNVDRLRALVEATHTAPKRNVMATPLYAALTGRMMLADAAANFLPGFVPSDILLADAANAIAASAAAAEDAGAAVPPTPRRMEVGFQVLSGSAETLLGALQAGVTGAVLAFASPAPEACHEIYRAWKANDLRMAEEKQQSLATASRLVAGCYGIPGLKHACDLNGYFGGVPRVPLLPLNAAQQAEVEAAMAGIRD